jgi:hypothetical protein
MSPPHGNTCFLPKNLNDIGHLALPSPIQNGRGIKGEGSVENRQQLLEQARELHSILKS